MPQKKDAVTIFLRNRAAWSPQKGNERGSPVFREGEGMNMKRGDRIRKTAKRGIADGAFTGCADPLTVVAPAGGAAENWCSGREGILFMPEKQD